MAIVYLHVDPNPMCNVIDGMLKIKITEIPANIIYFGCDIQINIIPQKSQFKNEFAMAV